MRFIQVEPAGPLQGSISIPGSKNSSLALLAAACLADGQVILEGIPDIYDVKVIARIGDDIGLRLQRMPDGSMVIDPRYIHSAIIDPGKASSFRASYYFAGALLAKFGRVTVGFPGGDDFSSRPIDQHIKAFQALGAKVIFHEDYYVVEAGRLQGADIYFDTVTSGATINSMLAAVRAHGRTNLYHAAVDPEVVDTAAFLNGLGAKIYGAGTDRIRIEGVPYLNGGYHTVIPDRLVAGAFLMAAGITRGRVTVTDVIPEHLGSCISKLIEAGLTVECTESGITAYGTDAIKATRIRTSMYPGFATDLQQPMTALLTQARGKSIITEKVYPNRFNHVPQLRRMGAEIEVRGESAFIRGGRPLAGNWVHATDVRAGTSLILAGLTAEGCTRITGVEHVERGYEDVIGSFRSLGARISLRDTQHAETAEEAAGRN
ncbi:MULTISPECIES: UDP-N-acetylglucosamine 1-carboxyvinyltransferase [Paenibacillus]|uniref:UDP-N-acetylglucosamine 1-carboxyvinyltransferase n=1 Tax=Paenibacillus naphthalenovorans TaxID=162209 RepID=A0A0U2W2Y7_9BACL|nr:MULTISPECIES: UDP-N-acetylglucosamine 1-carboxyvinyltransferase [Paenibacillus]ALS22916.1 UDP-N-acetylglucosamine 1-carboxyvinyltransferase [Paenibacillus naphthalenovorans]NTZ17485.1 UDP-N-acetylglucosamine 1-carboxyvinyltransferase [Paenibacillus sp. JMULE4]GCL72022.1 UDP-N-acetylglucosamine 1-carboxyvinyltransferase [Paenibacillus naphthalenovorans]SDI45575.1 UDP-N-acetylglucosamine 1-carboxyvinyltransferase [Paenibacillus naphthalenovorans]